MSNWVDVLEMWLGQPICLLSNGRKFLDILFDCGFSDIDCETNSPFTILSDKFSQELPASLTACVNLTKAAEADVCELTKAATLLLLIVAVNRRHEHTISVLTSLNSSMQEYIHYVLNSFTDKSLIGNINLEEIVNYDCNCIRQSTPLSLKKLASNFRSKMLSSDSSLSEVENKSSYLYSPKTSSLLKFFDLPTIEVTKCQRELEERTRQLVAAQIERDNEMIEKENLEHELQKTCLEKKELKQKLDEERGRLIAVIEEESRREEDIADEAERERHYRIRQDEQREYILLLENNLHAAMDKEIEFESRLRQETTRLLISSNKAKNLETELLNLQASILSTGEENLILRDTNIELGRQVKYLSHLSKQFMNIKFKQIKNC